MEIEEFKKEVEKLGLELTEEKLQKLEKYYNILVEENKKINLTRITEKKDVYLKHFYDSLTITKVIDLNDNITLIDIGTGAGFPGIVLKIFFPNLKITLLDALEKRIVFLNKVIKELDLKDIETVHNRIEDYKDKKYDIVTSRAVAKTNILSELAIDLVKESGHYIFLKSDIDEELKNSKKAFDILGLKLEHVKEFYLPKENSKRTILKIKKIKKHMSKYPRNFAKIKKSPL